MTPPVGTRVRIPGLATRSSRAWVVGTLVAALGVTLYAASTQAGARIPAGIGAVAVLVIGVMVLTGRREVDTAARVLEWRRWLWPRATVRRDALQAVALVPNGAGVLTLELRTARRTRRLAVAGATAYLRASLPPPALLAVAELLDGVPPVTGAPAVVHDLCRQAAHLAAGGGFDDSPLAARTRR